jgi:hypothetical protein
MRQNIEFIYYQYIQAPPQCLFSVRQICITAIKAAKHRIYVKATHNSDTIMQSRFHDAGKLFSLNDFIGGLPELL